jgi:signal peptidase I
MNNKNVGWEIFTWIRDIGIAILIVWIIITFLGQKTNVIGSSMQPTLQNGNHLIIDKISYRFADIKRFDIVIFPYHGDHSQNYIKRVIGLPGEKVDIRDGKIYINNELLDENYGLEQIKDYGNQKYPLEVPEGEYFVMGDNRNHSSDSRYQDVGTIKKTEIIGKAIVRIWPISKSGLIK